MREHPVRIEDIMILAEFILFCSRIKKEAARRDIVSLSIAYFYFVALVEEYKINVSKNNRRVEEYSQITQSTLFEILELC